MVLALPFPYFNLDCRMTASAPFSAGARFREALAAESPLQVIGAINANHALLAKRAGFRANAASDGQRSIITGGLTWMAPPGRLRNRSVVSLQQVLQDRGQAHRAVL